MGDRRYRQALHKILHAADRAEAIRALSDEEVIHALAAASENPQQDPYLANVLATEAQNRMRRSRTIAEHLAEGAFSVDEHGRLSFVNPTLAEQLGGTWQDYVGRDFRDAITLYDEKGEPLTRTPRCPIETALSQGKVARFEGYAKGLGDARVPASVIVAPVAKEGETVGAVVSYRDLTAPQLLAHERNEERKFQETLLSAQSDLGEGLAIVGPDRFYYANDALCRITGYAHDELMRLPGPGPILAPRERERLRAEVAAREASAEASRHFETRILTKTGEERVCEFSFKPVPWDARGVVLALVRDVTPRARAQDAIEAERARLATILDAVREGIMLLDEESRPIFVNASAQRILGASAHEVIGTRPEERPYEFFALDGGPMDPDAFPAKRAMTRREPVLAFRYQIKTRSASKPRTLESDAIPLIDARHRVTGAVVSFLDITDAIEAESATRRLASLVETSQDAILHETIESIILDWNEGATRLFAYAKHETLGRHVEFLVPQERRHELETINHRVARGEFVPPRITKRIRKDGSLVDVSLLISPVRDEAGNIASLSATYRDVTTLVEAERALRSFNASLERRVEERTRDLQEALRDLETFTDSASHDLRAPLRGTHTLLDELARAAQEGDLAEARDLAERALRENEKASRLVHDLLSFAKSRRKDLAREPVDLTALALEVTQDIQRRHPHYRTAWRIAPDMRAQGDPMLLRIMLDQLLGNGAKYSRRAAVSEVEFTSTRAGAELVFHVRDNGIGFAPEEAYRLFQPFARLSSAQGFEGTGLGLPTAARIVQRHGGRIWATSRLGEGATFHFTLPDEDPANRPPPTR